MSASGDDCAERSGVPSRACEPAERRAVPSVHACGAERNAPAGAAETNCTFCAILLTNPQICDIISSRLEKP